MHPWGTYSEVARNVVCIQVCKNGWIRFLHREELLCNGGTRAMGFFSRLHLAAWSGCSQGQSKFPLSVLGERWRLFNRHGYKLAGHCATFDPYVGRPLHSRITTRFTFPSLRIFISRLKILQFFLRIFPNTDAILQWRLASCPHQADELPSEDRMIGRRSSSSIPYAFWFASLTCLLEIRLSLI